MRLPIPTEGKHTGITIGLPVLGDVALTQVFAQNGETYLYLTDRPAVLVKLFDLTCGRPEEISYGPYVAFQSELANFDDVLKVDALRRVVPAYYGAQTDFERKLAWIAMEFLAGLDLRSWCDQLQANSPGPEELVEMQRAIHEMLLGIELFHRNGFVLIDFKPDNVIRLADGAVRFVDLGALYAPRHGHELQTFVYSATPDHAEVLIDASNLQAGVAPSGASDVFAAGVALFELATRGSRLSIDPRTAQEILRTPRLYSFQDSQTRDVWKAYPHLREVLPLLRTQLEDGQLLFADLWHLLKAYLAHQASDWDSMPAEQRDHLLLATGTTFIKDQLPSRLAWLATPIARATVLRSLRLKDVSQLVEALRSPASDDVLEDLRQYNSLVAMLQILDLPGDFVEQLNTWDVRREPEGGHWAMAVPAAARALGDTAEFVYLRRVGVDALGHAFLRAVDELEADVADERRLNLAGLAGDHRAWVGSL